MTTVTESFPLTLAATLLLIGAFIGALRFIATAGDKQAAANRELLRDATPVHTSGPREGADERGRPW